MKTIDERVQEFWRRGAFTQADLTDLLDELAKDQVNRCLRAIEGHEHSWKISSAIKKAQIT